MPNVELHLGDCLEVMRTLPDGCVDAIITDLPYGTTACSWDEVIPFAPMWEQVKRVLKPRGVFVTTASQPFTSKLVMSNLEWFRQALVWDKMQGGKFALAKVRPLPAHEDILVFCAGATTYNPQLRQKDRQNVRPAPKPRRANDIVPMASGITRVSDDYDPGISYPTTVLRYSSTMDECNSCKRQHPTQKPVALYAYLIRTYTNPGDTVLDFCMGSGTTGVAAAKEGRHFVGVELDSGYFAIAQRRIEQAQMQLPLLEPAA